MDSQRPKPKVNTTPFPLLMVDAVLPPPGTLDGGSEVPQSHPQVIFHGLVKLHPWNHFLPVPSVSSRVPQVQKAQQDSFFSLDGIPHHWCPTTGSRVATMTDSDQLTGTAPVSYFNNGGAGGPWSTRTQYLLPWTFVKFWELKLLLAGYSARHHNTFRVYQVGLASCLTTGANTPPG